MVLSPRDTASKREAVDPLTDLPQPGDRHCDALGNYSGFSTPGRRAPYTRHGPKQTPNSADGVYRDGGKQSTLRLTERGSGYIGRLALGVRV
jgi:hypothetical protein